MKGKRRKNICRHGVTGGLLGMGWTEPPTNEKVVEGSGGNAVTLVGDRKNKNSRVDWTALAVYLAE